MLFLPPDRDDEPDAPSPGTPARPGRKPIAVDRRTGKPVYSLVEWFEELCRSDADNAGHDGSRPAGRDRR